MKEKTLTDKQERFCREYVVDFNATQAAIRAGYSKNGAQQSSFKLLLNTVIQSRIQQLQEKASKRLEITVDQIVREFAKIGFADISEFFKDGYKLRPISELENRQTAAIQSLKIKPESGEIEFKLHDKQRALENLAKHLGFYKEDHDQSKNDPVNIILEYVPPRTEES